MVEEKLKNASKTEYVITEFGAKSCDKLQTKPIQNAIDQCFLQGGGRVVIPRGIYLTGGLRLRSNVVLYLESGAVLKGSIDPEDYTGYLKDEIEPIDDFDDETISRSVYPFSRWNNAIIRVIDAKNVAIIGEKGSYIDGQNCYDSLGEEGYRGPHVINIQRSEGVLLDGYSLKDSANWAHAIFQTKNIVAKNLTVYGGHDGFDIRTCDNVLIEHCNFYTGDDCIAGFDNHDVVIRDCILDCACSALRFGGNHVLVENCKSVAPSRYGFRGSLSEEQRKARAETDEHCRHNMHTPFKYYCDFRAEIRKTPGDIIIRNCEFENPDAFFQLEFDGKHKWCTNRSLSSIRFEHCKAWGVSKPILIHGDEKEPLEFVLDHVEITARKGYEHVNVLEGTHYSKISFQSVTLNGYESPSAVLKTKGRIEITQSSEIIIKEERGDSNDS